MSTARYEALLQRFPVIDKPEQALEGCEGPTILFPIGISGSGKSSALSAAVKKGWTVLNADEVRRQHLRELNAAGQNLELNGRRKVPNPDLPEDVFAPELRKRLPEWILSDFEKALERRKSVVLDITNLTLERVRYILRARARNFTCVALLFPSLDLSINASRVKGRGQRGGLDLVDPNNPDSDQKRMKILERLDGNFWCYLECLELMSGAPSPLSESEISCVDFQKMKDFQGDLESYLLSLSQSEKEIAHRLALNDRFDRVFVLRAPLKTVPK